MNALKFFHHCSEFMNCFKTTYTEEARTFQKIVLPFLIDITKHSHKPKFILLTFLHICQACKKLTCTCKNKVFSDITPKQESPKPCFNLVAKFAPIYIYQVHATSKYILDCPSLATGYKIPGTNTVNYSTA